MRSRALWTALVGWMFLASVAPVPASAQGAGGTPVSPAQLNRLSLEALTAPPPAGSAPIRRGGGYRYRGYRRGYARPYYRRRPVYRARPAYRTRVWRRSRSSYRPRPYRGVARHSAYHRPYGHHTYRRRR